MTYLAIIILGIISYFVGKTIKKYTLKEVQQGRRWIETWVNLLGIISPLLIIGYMSINTKMPWLIFISIFLFIIMTFSLYFLQPALIHGICIGILPSYLPLPVLYYLNNLAESSINNTWKNNLTLTVIGIIIGIVIHYFYFSTGILFLLY